MTETPSTDIPAAVRAQVARMLRPEIVPPEAIDLRCSLTREYGLTSMKMVLMMTGLCERLDVQLSCFTDRDIAGIDTGHDLVAALEQARQGDPT
ncbi:hypothetical protein [uncultured Methylobacterium sp.]|uniref:acyl carrier protein n=1 Tax=uncultured Methylobacterium sp. TaxID=157278 RepID=UPI00259550BB|nr:hypothetical protein [uncultured Methylobacterium sp.]